MERLRQKAQLGQYNADNNQALVVRNILRKLPGIPMAQVTATLKHEFNPENLYKLRHTYDRTQDDSATTMELNEDGSFKVKGQDKGFRRQRKDQCFLNYIRIIGYLFPQVEVPLAMMNFHDNVTELSKIST
jgi:hypothetical protein